MEVAEGTPEAPQEEYIPESATLTPEEVKAVINDEPAPKDEVLLNSEREAQNAIPEKFKDKSPEDIIKMYTELESKLGAKETPPPEAETPPAKEEPTPKPEATSTESLINETLDKYGADVPDDVLEELGKKGITKGLLKTVMDGKRAETRAMVDDMTKDFGGVEEYNKAIGWAKENWSPEEISTFDSAIAQTDGKPELVKLVVANLMNSYKRGNSTPNQPIHTNGTPSVKHQGGFTSKQDMYADMNSPLYGTDAKYMEKFQARMALTDQSSWYN